MTSKRIPLRHTIHIKTSLQQLLFPFVKYTTYPIQRFPLSESHLYVLTLFVKHQFTNLTISIVFLLLFPMFPVGLLHLNLSEIITSQIILQKLTQRMLNSDHVRQLLLYRLNLLLQHSLDCLLIPHHLPHMIDLVILIRNSHFILPLHKTYSHKSQMVKYHRPHQHIPRKTSKKNRTIMVEHNSPPLGLIVLPKSKICIKINILQDTKTLPLITSIHLSIVNTIQLMYHSAININTRTNHTNLLLLLLPRTFLLNLSAQTMCLSIITFFYHPTSLYNYYYYAMILLLKLISQDKSRSSFISQSAFH